MRAGGQISIATPNTGALCRRVFDADWVGLEAPRHLVLFTADSLLRAVADAGFDRARVVRSANKAVTSFRQSETIRSGANPFDRELELGAREWVRARLVAAAERVRPALAEELVVTAV
jgi:hypothetical protein